MKKYILLITLLALVLAACGDEPDPTPTLAPTAAPVEEALTEEVAEETAAAENWEPVGCETFGIDAQIAGALECGYVTVPENRASGSEATIRLAVARVPTDAENPGAPVFELTGGPGQMGFGTANVQAFGLRNEILADRDWIYFSQRGTEFSEPFLNCPDYNTAPFEGGINGWTAEEQLEFRINAMQACVDDFRAQGVDLSAYNSNENAADINDIRQALGYDQIILYGESYGTQLAQFLMRSHPEILEAVILDGVVPVEFERGTDVTDIPGAFERVFAGCANNEACNNAYPDLQADLAAAIEAILTNPPTLPVPLGGETVEMEVDSILALNALFINLYNANYTRIPTFVSGLAGGDVTPLQAALPLLFSASDNARVQHFAINCSDDPLASLDDLDLEGLPDYYQELVIDDAQGLVSFCPILDVPQLDGTSDAPVTADVPVLLLQGGFDPATPVEGGNLVAESLPNATNVVFPAGAHIQSNDPCGLAIMDAFMTDPTTAPDTSCINQEVVFATPLDATIASAEGDASMSLTLTPGYAEGGPVGPLQSYINGARQQLFGGIFGADEERDARTTIDFIVDEVFRLDLEEREYSEGDPVAGYPTQRLQAAAIDANSGNPFGVDVVTFEDEDGRVYALTFLTLVGSDVPAFRESGLSNILDTVTVGGPVEGGAAAAAEGEEACPLFDLPYPRPEPEYDAKLVRDLSPFQEALDTFDPARAAELDGLLTGVTILDIQGSFESGELTSEELVLYYIDRIQRYDIDGLNSVMTINPAALEIARALDEERAAGTVHGDMHGIPVLLKDNIATGDGMAATAGAVVMADWQPDRDAGLVSKLRDAGAVILGKANLSEWANYMDSCMPNGFSALGGQTENPYGPFETYGSSSGSAVAAAASLSTVTVGSETQGSMIRPADINSVVGIKTSKGLVSGDNIIPLLPFQDVAGPMARNVTDAAILLTAMAGVDENDPETEQAAQLDGTDFSQFASMDAAEGLRIGITIYTDEDIDGLIESLGIPEDQQDQLREEIAAQNEGTRALGQVFAAAGMEVVEIPVSAIPTAPDAVEVLRPGYKRAVNEFLAGLGDMAPVGSLEEIIAFNNEDPANRMPYGQDHLEASQASDLTDEEWTALREEHISAATEGLRNVFDTYGVDMFVDNSTQAYAAAGYPAITIPVAYDANGQPVSFHIIGDYLGEPALITAGYVLEQATEARVEPDLEATMQLIEEVTGG